MLVNLTANSFDRPTSRIAYQRALVAFFEWFGERELTWRNVNDYRRHLVDESGLAAASINLRLCAIRKMCKKAWLAKAITLEDHERLKHINNIKSHIVRVGTWLTKEQMQQLLDAPLNKPGLKCSRDRAMLAVMMGCGVRREELCSLTPEHFRRVKGCWTIADLLGKGNKTRTIPMGDWCASLLQTWVDLMKQHHEVEGLPLFPQIKKGIKPTIHKERMTTQNVYKIVQTYSKSIGIEVTPHDLRRSFARLAEESGANLYQISLSLGHADSKTTMLYLGGNQSFTESPGQRISLEVKK